MIDHDRLFKKLLSTFFIEFIELFFPDVIAYIEPDSIVFLDKEVFTDVTAGDRYDVIIEKKPRHIDYFHHYHLYCDRGGCSKIALNLHCRGIY
jgi:hypothetical protein